MLLSQISVSDRTSSPTSLMMPMLINKYINVVKTRSSYDRNTRKLKKYDDKRLMAEIWRKLISITWTMWFGRFLQESTAVSSVKSSKRTITVWKVTCYRFTLLPVSCACTQCSKFVHISCDTVYTCQLQDNISVQVDHEGESLEQVHDFKFLGSYKSADGNCTKKLKDA